MLLPKKAEKKEQRKRRNKRLAEVRAKRSLKCLTFRALRRSVKDLVLELDGYDCINIDCEDKEKLRQAGITHPQVCLQVHHLIPLGQRGPDTPENEASVSPTCHDLMQHGGKDRNGVWHSAHWWNLKILEPHRGKPYWRWEEAYQWHQTMQTLKS